MNVTGKVSNPPRPASNTSLLSKIREAFSSGPKLPKRARWIIGSLLLVAIAGAFAYYRLVYVPSLTSSEPAMQTSVVRQGTLVISATGTGTLISKDEINLAFQKTGEVTEVNVKVGDQVKPGDVLAKIDNTSLKTQYDLKERALAELTSASALADAEAAVATA